jgi:hypothetical protein
MPSVVACLRIETNSTMGWVASLSLVPGEGPRVAFRTVPPGEQAAAFTRSNFGMGTFGGPIFPAKFLISPAVAERMLKHRVSATSHPEVRWVPPAHLRLSPRVKKGIRSGADEILRRGERYAAFSSSWAAVLGGTVLAECPLGPALGP